jgi:hypothetical protein
VLRASPSSYTLFFPYLNIYYLLKPLQIYGILLNICGILLNIRGKTEKNGEFRGILWNFHGKYVENHSFSFLFIPSPPQITPILCSKTYSMQILLKFLAFFLAVPIILRTFAIGYKIVVIYSAMATVSPRLHAVGFFYAYKVSFSRQREKGLFNMAVA